MKMSDTPAAEWRVNGDKDPHEGKYECRRLDLTLGNLTDDQLANDVFMYGDNKPSIHEIMAGTAKMPVIYLTAGKERIRWLSRLAEAQKIDNDRMVEEIAELKGMLQKTATAIYSYNNEMVGTIAVLNCASESIDLLEKLNQEGEDCENQNNATQKMVE